MIDILHAGLGWPIALMLIALSFVTSLMTAAFGIGGGAVMLAAMASLLPPAAIIPVHGIVQFGSNVGRFIIFRADIRWQVFAPFAIGALAGVATGGALVVQFDAAVIELAVGAFILWSVYAPMPGFMTRSALIAGAVSSFLTMFFGGTGPFVAAFVRAQRYDRMGHVATHATLMTLQHLLKTLTFGFLGFAFSQWLGFVALVIAAGFLGTLAGRKVLFRIDERRFTQILGAILTILALRLIYSGVTGLVGRPQEGG